MLKTIQVGVRIALFLKRTKALLLKWFLRNDFGRLLVFSGIFVDAPSKTEEECTGVISCHLDRVLLAVNLFDFDQTGRKGLKPPQKYTCV